jgi:glutamyl-tRNA reductase
MEHPHLFCIGVSHHTAPQILREKLFLEAPQIEASLPLVVKKYMLTEAMVLSTCNRFEIYFVCPSTEALWDAQPQLIRALHEAIGIDIGLDQELSQLSRYVYIYQDRKAVEHAFGVCSALDSLVLGETQITNQFKAAWQLCKHIGVTGAILHRLVSQSLSVSKMIRSQTEIGCGSVSVGSAAVDLVRLIFGRIEKHKVAIIGAGEMARLAAQHIVKYQPRELFIINRSAERAELLIKQLKQGTHCAIEQIESVLSDVDIVISATSSSQLILDKTMIENVMRHRSSRSFCAVDIALPRDIDSAVHEIENVFYFDIDDLKEVVDRSFKERKTALVKADQIVFEAADRFENWRMGQTTRSTLAAVDNYLKSLIDKEFRKTIKKSHLAELDDQQRRSIEKLTGAIGRKILADISLAMHSSNDLASGGTLSEVLEQIFVLDIGKDKS